MATEHKILIVEDDQYLATSLRDILTGHGYRVEVAESYETARPHLPSAYLIIMDLRLPDKPGIELLKELKELHPEAEVLITTGYADEQSAIDACNLGAFAYLRKPVSPDMLLLFLKRALERQQLALELNRKKHEITGLTGFTGTILNDRVKMLEEAKEREERLSRLYRGIGLSFRALNPTEAARSLLPLIVEETNANNAALNIIGTDGKVIDRLDYFKGMEPFKVRSRAGGTRDEVIRTKKPLIIPDMAKHPNPSPDLVGIGIQSMCVYPLIVDDLVCGTLLLASLKVNAFADMEQTIAPFADLCAIPLRQAIICMETDRKQRIWEATVNAMRVGVAIIDTDRNIIQSNKTLADMAKVPLEDLPGKNVCKLVCGHPQPTPECPMEEVCNSNKAASITMRSDFLNIKRLQLRVAPVHDEHGKITRFVQIFRDLDILREEYKPEG